jgi:stage V sporulation protein SpoVS
VPAAGDELIDKYRWLTDGWPTGLGEAGCVTVVVAADRETVLDAFAAEQIERVPIEDAADVSSPQVAVVDAGNGQVAVELNGYEGSRPDVLARASRRGKAASVYWEINGMVIVSCASRGRLVASVDLSVDDQGADLPARLRSLLRAEDGDLVAVGAAMVERYTGIAIQPGFLADLGEAYVVCPRPDERDIEDPERTTLRYDYPHLVSGIVSAAPTVRRRLAEWCAEQALATVGLAAQDAIREVTGQFGRSSAARQTLKFTQLVARVSREERRGEAAFRREEYSDDWDVPRVELEAGQAAAHREWNRAIRQEFALAAVAYACQNDSVSAALGAVDSALYSVDSGQTRDAFAGKVADLLANPTSGWPEDVSWLPG